MENRRAEVSDGGKIQNIHGQASWNDLTRWEDTRIFVT